MIRPGWLLPVLLVAGCGQQVGSPAPDPRGAASSVAPPSATPRKQIGTVSGLSGQSSALTGTVSGFAIRVTDTATVVALAADTLFAFDKAELAPEALANLRRTADLVAKGGAGTVTVTGYTDAKGEDAYNLALSERRADAVAAWLRAQPSLSGRAFATIGRGEADPVAPNARPDGTDDPDGRARNRRVEVSIPR